jgi:hypothetical protein
MKIAVLTLALAPVLSVLPATAQAPPQSAAERAAQAEARAKAAIEAAKAPPVEDFKPSVLNQRGKEYPQVNSERRVRARVVAPEAHSVALDIGAV